MKIKLYFFGKKTDITAAEQELQRRIKFRVEFEFIPLPQAGLTDGKSAKTVEAKTFFKKYDSNTYLIAFDENGRVQDSNSFSKEFTNILESKKEVSFVIGGAYGLDQSILEVANQKLSLGQMVWTRNLVRHMACEQIYRALDIAAGGNFHKA